MGKEDLRDSELNQLNKEKTTAEIIKEAENIRLKTEEMKRQLNNLERKENSKKDKKNIKIKKTKRTIWAIIICILFIVTAGFFLVSRSGLGISNFLSVFSKSSSKEIVSSSPNQESTSRIEKHENETIKMADYKFPAPIGYVNDFERILTQTQISDLNKIISKNEKETTDEIVVVTIKTFEPFPSLYDYSLGLASNWGVGKKDRNNGIVIVLSRQPQQIRIQVGKGLEKKLNNERTQQIIENTIIPELKNGDFYNGFKKGVLEIIGELKK